MSTDTTPTPAAHLSQAAFARLMGVSRPAVSQWKARGLLVLGEGGLVDVAASQALLAANRSPVMEAAQPVEAAIPDPRSGKVRSLNRFAFAREVGVPVATVDDWGARGLLVITCEIGVEQFIDVEATRALLSKAGVIPRPAIPLGDGETAEEVVASIMERIGVAWNYQEARAMKEGYLALLNQLEYDRESASVVAVAEVAAAVGAEYAQVRTKLLAIPAEHAPRIARLKTVTEIQDALLELITEALEGLTRDAPPPAS